MEDCVQEFIRLTFLLGFGNYGQIDQTDTRHIQMIQERKKEMEIKKKERKIQGLLQD